MKNIYLFLLLILVLNSCGILSEHSFLSDEELENIKELNYARTNPHGYAEDKIKPLVEQLKIDEPATMKYFSMSLGQLLSMDPKTVQDVSERHRSYMLALFTAYYQLKDIQPMSKLIPTPGLVAAARAFISDPSRDSPHHSNNGLGDPGDSFILAKFFSKDGKGGVGEIAWDKVSDKDCIHAYGNTTFALGWIIDDGNFFTAYGHRTLIINPNLHKFGFAVGIGKGKVYGGKMAAYGTFAEDDYVTNKKLIRNKTWTPKEIKWKLHGNSLPKCPL